MTRLEGAYPDRIALYANEDDFGRLGCANDIWLDHEKDALEIVARREVRFYVPEDSVNWKPISTAPRDGTWFLARTANGYTRQVHYLDRRDRLPIGSDDENWTTAPVEWKPTVPPEVMEHAERAAAILRGARQRVDHRAALTQILHLAREARPAGAERALTRIEELAEQALRGDE